MASKNSPVKAKKLLKTSGKASTKRTAGTKSKKKLALKPTSSARKATTSIKAKKNSAKQSANGKVKARTLTGRGRTGKRGRTIAMVRRAASSPASGRKTAATGAGTIAKRADKAKAKPTASVNAAPTPPTTETEPKLTPADLEYFRGLLLEKRRELLGDMGSMESHAFNSDGGHSSSPIHMADVGSDNFEQEFTLGLLESERQTLREIHEAIERVDNGTFGICVATGKLIGRARLEAKPWAKYCIEYARQLERGQPPRSMDVNSHHHDDADDDED